MTPDPIFPSVDALQEALAGERYIAERGLAVSIYLALRLKRPLFLEGEAGVGKTEVARVLASALKTTLIRLQCYEGLDVSQAVYEWNYPRQLLEIRMIETAGELDRAAATHELFTETFLIKRPLLRAIEETRDRAPVLLIDELDRADEEFEGYLLEFLSDFQVTIPELGTIRAHEPPIVIITSNRTREVHDALKRRCVYSWIPYPDFDKELRIVRSKVPGASVRLARQVTAFRSGYLLEFLSDFQVTIPELGTIRAHEPPIVIITSNRTREVHDALKRRCVYSWIPYPDFDKELRIVRSKVPGASVRLARQVTAF